MRIDDPELYQVIDGLPKRVVKIDRRAVEKPVSRRHCFVYKRSKKRLANSTGPDCPEGAVDVSPDQRDRYTCDSAGKRL